MIDKLKPFIKFPFGYPLLISGLLFIFSCSNLQRNDQQIQSIRPNGYEHLVQNDTIPAEFTSENLGQPIVQGYFRSLHWKDSLRKEDIQANILAIDSCRNYGEFHPNLMMPLLIHRAYDVLEKDSLYQWEKYRKYFKETENLVDKNYDKYLLSQIDRAKLKKLQVYFRHHYFSIDDVLLNVLVIRQSKLLRRGLSVNVELKDTVLNTYQKSLLHYSRFSLDKAIDTLFSQILNPGPVLTVKETVSLSILSSYGRPSTIKAFEYLKDTTYLAGLEKFGIKQLLDLLQINANFYLLKNEQKEMLDFLKEKKVYKGVFNEHRSQLAFIKSSITGQPWEISMENFGFYYDPESNRMRNIEERKSKIND